MAEKKRPEKRGAELTDQSVVSAITPSPSTPRLGCGTLVMLFLVVALAGKFLPHDRASPESADGSPSHQRDGEVAESPPFGHLPGGLRATLPDAGPEVIVDDAKAPLDQLKEEWGSLLGVMEAPDPSPASERSAAPREELSRSPGGAPAESEKSYGTREPKGPRSKTARIRSHENFQKGTDVHPVKPALLAKRQEAKSVSVDEVWVGSRGSEDTPAKNSGDAALGNAPWHGSVSQVERYLKRHIHDAGSLEVMEWSPVVASAEGYLVRCTYRSRNILGAYATQTQTFLLDEQGNVLDIRN